MSFTTNITTLMRDSDRMDETDGTVTYFGFCNAGKTNPADAVYQIYRLRQVGTEYIKEWADGNDMYDNIWTNRTILTYSQLK